jgi:hypothetical protein
VRKKEKKKSKRLGMVANGINPSYSGGRYKKSTSLRSVSKVRKTLPQKQKIHKRPRGMAQEVKHFPWVQPPVPKKKKERKTPKTLIHDVLTLHMIYDLELFFFFCNFGSTQGLNSEPCVWLEGTL